MLLELDDSEVPPQFLCPITCSLMRDPATTTDGHAFERSAIEEWLAGHRTSPITNEVLISTAVYPNLPLRTLIDDFIARKLGEWRAARRGAAHPQRLQVFTQVAAPPPAPAPAPAPVAAAGERARPRGRGGRGGRGRGRGP